MSNEKEIICINEYRIVEIEYLYFDINDLKGDCYSPKFNPEVPIELLREQEIEFEKTIYRAGVFGYALERWDETIGVGWTYVESCFGFVGRYAEENHYIVEEYMEMIKNNIKGLKQATDKIV